MEFELSWIVLGLPLAFALGWFASRLDLRQMREDSRRAPKAYFKGLNYLLNEQQDQAIDAFIEAVQSDPDTTELHFALGNLFRRRGEYNRAVRVHEHLLSRGDLGRADRDRAQHALALDFLKAGLLDRAEDALLRLEGSPFESQARMALLAIYERSRDWARASDIAQRMQDAHQGDFSTRQAHYLCEQALAHAAHGELEAARTLFEQAVAKAPQAGRARIELARLAQRMGRDAEALEHLRALSEAAPAALPLAAALLAETAARSGQASLAHTLLVRHYEAMPSLDLVQAIVALESAGEAGAAQARHWWLRHLDHEPSLVAATQWLAGETLGRQQHHPQVQGALEHACKPLTRYRCAACGFEARQHFWQCPGCQSWDSYPARRVEEL
ncbi:lipopolysaccharide assembly protein LapB [Melaminivora sp.]|uniref:lipopolysaccharide assembly protein LapB n=1 Tax=Melaminivora sp. TaxID=1933032 RepID=UPI0028B1DB2E|nr:lipopolysaccharide assembly protein LapB [Melaminivora sp.]